MFVSIFLKDKFGFFDDCSFLFSGQCFKILKMPLELVLVLQVLFWWSCILLSLRWAVPLFF